MSEQEMAGEDASLDAAVDKLMSIGMSNMIQDGSKLDRLENDDGAIDVNTQDGTTDLEEIEREERAKGGDEQEAGEDAGDKTEGGEEAPTFLELVLAEGQEAEKIPLTEAAELIKQARQFNGDVATAVAKIEDESYQKQDQVMQQLNQAFVTVRDNAQVAIRAMEAYLPQPPDPVMLDRNSGYYNPEGYHLAKIHYDQYVAYREQLRGKLAEAEKGIEVTTQHQNQEFVRRENERIARFIPAWKDEKAREARKAEILDVLSKRYNVSKADIDDIVDHKAWRMMNDLTDMVKGQAKAPEVRKAVQEKAPKLTKEGALPQRDSQGRFLNEARSQLKQSGSEDAFVNYLLKAGAVKRR